MRVHGHLMLCNFLFDSICVIAIEFSQSINFCNSLCLSFSLFSGENIG